MHLAQAGLAHSGRAAIGGAGGTRSWHALAIAIAGLALAADCAAQPWAGGRMGSGLPRPGEEEGMCAVLQGPHTAHAWLHALTALQTRHCRPSTTCPG